MSLEVCANFPVSSRLAARGGLLLTLLAVGLSPAGCDDDSGNALVPEPTILESTNGVLQMTLTAAPTRVVVAGQGLTLNVYNGTYVPPVLKLRRGEVLELTLVNQVGAADIQVDDAQPTNMHYHGMAISPVAPADDIYLHLMPGAQFNYRWQVPMDHPQGAHWYHPHPHGFTEPQILSGMSGLLLIDGLVEEHYPAFAGLVERNLLLKDIELPGAEDGAPSTKTINGVLGGVLPMQPGELQVWNLGNIGANAFFDFAVDGAQLWEIGRDGNVLEAPKQVDSVFLPPASRSTVVIVAPTTPGRYAVRSLEVDTGPQGDPNPEVQLALLDVSGPSMEDPALVSRLTEPAVNRETAGPTIESLEALPITRQRTITFSETEDGNTFFIDGRTFDIDRNDAIVNLGDVEEWTVRNVSGERHVFHIHQLDFLVQSINNQDIDETGLRDTIDVPYQQNGVPGEVTLIVPFTNPVMVGRFVYHCHLAEHEDGGMMANIVVLPPGQTAPPPAQMRHIRPADNSLLARLRKGTAARFTSDVESWFGRSSSATSSATDPFTCSAARRTGAAAGPTPLRP